MLWQECLKILFKLMQLLGIMPVAYCKNEQKLIVTEQYERHMFRVTIAMLILVEVLNIVVCLSAFSDLLDFYSGSKTSNMMMLLQLLECGVIQLCLSTMFYVFRNENVRIFNTILMYHKYQFPNQSSGFAEKMISLQCIMNFFLVIVFVGNVAISTSYTWSSSWSTYACNVLLLSINFIYSSIYISCLTCLLYILTKLLKSFNDRLQIKVQLKDTVEDIVELLAERNALLTLCSKHINVVYGLTMLIQSVYILSCISTFLFLTIVMFNLHNADVTTVFIVLVPISLYSLPPLMIYMNVLWINDIDKEIDKFLLKNLRQKPILTAYGFFSLDKSTLFKLFTTVFTYMVVLVQFKEMESNTKNLPNGS